MDFTFIYLFVLGALLSFLGTLPLGPINLSVVDATIKYHIRAAMWMATGAAIVEICNSFIALYCNTYVNDLLGTGFWPRFVTGLCFLLFGLVFFLKKNKAQPKKEGDKKSNRHFLRGIGIAMLNIQSIPFWIYIFASLKSFLPRGFGPHMGVTEIVWLLTGIAFGKFMALLGFGWLSKLVESQASNIGSSMNKIIGSILIIVGIIQAFRAFL